MNLILDADTRQRYGISEAPMDESAMNQRTSFGSQFLMDSRMNFKISTEGGEQAEVPGCENPSSYYLTLVSRCHEQARKQDHSEIAPYAKALLQSEEVTAGPLAFGILCDSLLAKEAEAYGILALRAECGVDSGHDRKDAKSPLQGRMKLNVLIAGFCDTHQDPGSPGTKQKPEERF